jgi:hypothetical protein
MADNQTLVDGDFSRPSAVGARRYEYPFRTNGDRVTAIFEEDYWQTKATYTPTEFPIPHAEIPDFYLIDETEPRETIAGILTFTRTYARVPSEQTEYSSLWFTIPSVGSVDGLWNIIFGLSLGLPNGTDPGVNTSNYFGGGAFAPNFFYGPEYSGGTFFYPMKVATPLSYTANRTVLNVPGHGYTNAGNPVLAFIRGNLSDRANSGFAVLASASTNTDTSGSWQVINANAINGPFAHNFMGYSVNVAAPNRGGFGTNSRYMRCRRITTFYLPGVTPGIATPSDIPLPSDDSQTTAVFDALISGTGTFNERVGEITRWRDSAIYMITRTVIDVADVA